MINLAEIAEACVLCGAAWVGVLDCWTCVNDGTMRALTPAEQSALLIGGWEAVEEIEFKP